MKRIAKYFLHGLLFLVPVGVTIYLFCRAFIAIDDLLGIRIHGKIIRGMGFLIVVAGTTFIGFLASNFLTKRILRMVERLFARLPLVKLVYSSLKDLIGAFVGDKKGFDRPVTVTLFPGSDARVAGFLTRTDLEPLGMADTVAVYVPQSYNFAGNLLFVPRDRVTPLKLDPSKAMALIISGGVARASAERESAPG
jgi:uncharacterized membrane protein